jgi:hypothetical protein
MKVVKRALWVLALGFGAGCAAEAVPLSDPAIAQVEQALTIFDCQAELAQCVRQARGLRALGECTTAFATCNVQAANDVLDETEVLNECRAEANTCLNGALTTADIRSCRGVFRTCAENAVANAQAVLDGAVDAAEDAIKKTADTATTVITNAVGIGSDAFGLLHQCREDATDCIAGVTSTADVGACRVIFDGCAADAVDLVESVVDPVPVAAGNLITCNAQFATCVLTFNSPFDCATDAQMCLGL